MHRIVVLGGGPGGYSAAFAAAEAGAQVTLVERARLGGTCLNVGCIPTKTILRTARLVGDVARATEFGLEPMAGASLNVGALRTRKQGVVDDLVGQVESTARRLKVEVMSGTGRLVAANRVSVERTVDGQLVTTELQADAVIIATGSVPVVLPFLNHELPNVWTSDDAVALERIPGEIVIVGGGVIGVEFACAYAAFGAKVTVVELSETLLPGNDKRVTRALATALTEQGITLLLGNSVASVEPLASNPARLTVTLASGETLETDVLMSAVGRAPNTGGFGFEELGIEFDRRAIAVNAQFQTCVPGVYAIGDAIGGMMLAHAAEVEGEAAALNALAVLDGQAPTHTVDNRLIPGCVYSFPEVAVVGRSAEGAKADELDAISAIAKFTGNGKALAEGESEGFVQLVVAREGGAILGAQMVGPHVVELIHEVSALMAIGGTVLDLAGHHGAVYAHPTVSEVVKVAARIAAAKVVVGSTAAPAAPATSAAPASADPAAPAEH